jgi:hypothetical protein
MAGDISRSSFNPLKEFSGVRMQQGRPQLDADWNEQVDIANYFTRAATGDIIGPAGAPADDAGFAITAVGDELAVGPGRMYVAGILCENWQEVLVAAAAVESGVSGGGSGSGSGGGGGEPSEGDPSMDVVIRKPAQPQLAAPHFSPDISTPTLLQPDLPGYALPTAPGMYSVYLDVWERDITAIEDPSILEIALGGVDTTTRTKIIWQVKLMPALGGCSPNFSGLFPPSTGEMQAQAQPNTGASTPCAVPAQAGYSSLENQLYRIEVHTPGNASTATFKWSRDNGSVVAAWLSNPASDQLVVSTLGRDQVLGFAGGQWVELTDDTHVLNGIPGTLVQLSNAQMVGQSPTLTLNLATASGSTSFASFPVNPIVRRWDQTSATAGSLTNGAVQLQEASWLNLENGVEVQFASGGLYHMGDFWLVPARTATALSSPTVVWPVDGSGNPLSQPALGITHHYAALAVVTLNASLDWTVDSDCRLIFNPIANPGAMYITSVNTLQPASELGNDTVIPIDTFLNGIKITCDAAIDPSTIKLATFSVTLDTPVYGATSETTGIYPGAIPMKVMANLAVGDPGNVSAFWIPTPQARSYLLEQMATFAAQTENNGEALASVTFKGNFIWEEGSSGTLVNGPAFGQPQQGDIGIQLPSGNGGRGGDFQCWFWVPGYTDPSFPSGYVPLLSYASIAGPDSTGDYVVVGEMSAASVAQMLDLAEPDTNARKIYTYPIEMAPGLTVFAYVPTNLERGGNFSTFGAPIYDPTTGSPFPGNIIPASDQPSAPHLLLAREDSATQGTTNIVEQPGGGGIVVQPPKEGGGGIIVEGGSGIFAWRIRGIYHPSAEYGYGYGYSGGGLGAELI